MRQKLFFKSNYNFDDEKKHVWKNLKQFGHKSPEQALIYRLIHKYTNYEEIMWSFYKEDKSFVMDQIKNILLEISRKDRTLAWDCEEIKKRYRRLYFEKNSKSKWVA
tara:strand:+ start:1495 stop:1815 length:321 start_codon:yes stop_codon:yes gene_type:complete